MIITAITIQARNKNRVSISVDGKYRFSLDVFQLSDLGLRLGTDYSDKQLTRLEQESQFGKLYGRALEYSLMRPHSAKEVRDYLYRKTRPTRTKTGDTRPGVSSEVTVRVFERLSEKGYIDDVSFTRYWVENRSLRKGASKRTLIAELRMKGVDKDIIEAALSDSERSDDEELQKVLVKKRSKYPDNQKLIAYLARQGFSYDDIIRALTTDD